MKNCHQKEYLFSLSRSQAIAFRLAKHHLRSSAEGIHRDVCDSEPGQSHTVQTQGVSRTSQIAQVAGAISGVQAQVASAASLALRARIRGLWPQDVADALWNKRDLVKIWCMRATLHYLPSEDLPLYNYNKIRKPHQQNFARRARGSAASTGISLGESNKVRGYPGRGVPLYSCGEAGRCGAWRVSLPMGPLCGWQLTGKGGSGVAWRLRAPCQPAK